MECLEVFFRPYLLNKFKVGTKKKKIRNLFGIVLDLHYLCQI